VTPATLAEPFAEFRERGRERLAAEQPDAVEFERSVDLRYRGQSFELSVPVPDGGVDAATLETLAARFHDRHRERYGHAYPDEPVELVTVRLRARGVVETPDLRPAATDGTVADARRERRQVTFDGEAVETAIYDRTRLPVGGSFDGPAVVEGPESTVVVRPGQRARVDEYASLLVEVAP
jgi:N-methylhydantoinase A